MFIKTSGQLQCVKRKEETHDIYAAVSEERWINSLPGFRKMTFIRFEASGGEWAWNAVPTEVSRHPIEFESGQTILTFIATS